MEMQQWVPSALLSSNKISVLLVIIGYYQCVHMLTLVVRQA